MRATPSENTVVTFGCRLNTYESQAIKELLVTAGKTNTIVVNTCAVTAEAERQARQAIRKLRRDHPTAQLIVTGCSAQVKPDQFLEMPEVHRVVGNDVKLLLSSYQDGAEKALVNDIQAVKETASHLVSGFEGKARAYVQVQNGCNHRCTFCLIPQGRGNSRSVPLGDIVAQVRQLVRNGYQEVVVTGVDITDYGQDLPGQPTLGQMLQRLLALVPELPRLRLSSVDPVEMDDDCWQLLAENERLMPHLHISLQAGDDLILKRMKRRHLRQDVIDFCETARRLRGDVVFGADIIAGFPTETDEMAENTLRLIDECDLTHLHVFPYSQRPQTPASRMPQVPRPIIKERAVRLRAKGQAAYQKHLDTMVGREAAILIEEADGAQMKGKTEHFTPLCLPTTKAPLGSVVKVRVTGYDEVQLHGISV